MLACNLGVRPILTSALSFMSALCGRNALELPVMVDISPTHSIMRSEVTAGLFKMVMKGYVFKGPGAKELLAQLNDPQAANSAIHHVSFLDAQEFAKRLSAQTGRKFFVPTEGEFFKAKGRMTGRFWTWMTNVVITDATKTKLNVLRCVDPKRCHEAFEPDYRCPFGTIRLVEERDNPFFAFTLLQQSGWKKPS